ncbi:MAG: HAD family hydrolase [Candidatus Poribacteria bacterium]|nr:HAD family hydrolase [Candidatus Poribacteria bacterium]
MKTITDIENIIFDFGGTLDGNGIHWRDRFFYLIKKQIPALTWEQFEYADHRSIADFVADERTKSRTLRQSAETILSGINHYLPIGIIDLALTTEQFCQPAEEFLKRNRDFLEKLASSYRLGVISNNFGNTQGWCDEYELTPLLDTVIDSTVVGIEKPDPQIFYLALDEMGISSKNSVYVGDTFSDDVVGSNQAGMFSAWLVGTEDKACPNPSLVDIFLSQLDTLTDFLA